MRVLIFASSSATRQIHAFNFFSYGRGLTDKQLARDTIGRARQSKKRAKDDIEDEDF